MKPANLLQKFVAICGMVLGFGDDVFTGLSAEQAYSLLDNSPALTAEEQTEDVLRHAEQAATDWEHEHEKLKERSKYLPADTVGAILKRPKAPRQAYIKDFLYAGAVTFLAANPKEGKTTFSLHALGALTRGQEFLGEKLIPTVVLYATEQTETSFTTQAAKVADLVENQNFRVILYEDNTIIEDKPVRQEDGQMKFVPTDVFPTSWEKQIALWTLAIGKNHAKVFVIDTLTAFSNFRSGEAFDPGVVQARLQELKILITKFPDLAILILHHLRKEKNDAGRYETVKTFSDIANSYALRAGSDQNILFYCPSSNEEDKMVRTVRIEGRFVDQETTFQIVLTPNGFGKRQQPVEEPAENEQDRLLALCLKDPALNDQPRATICEAYGFTAHQVNTFRQTYPRGTQPALFQLVDNG